MTLREDLEDLADIYGSIYLRPTQAALHTLAEERAGGWWADPDIIPRNRQNQRIIVDGVSYRVTETSETHQEYRDNRLRQGVVWTLDRDPDPSAPAYRREPLPPRQPPRS